MNLFEILIGALLSLVTLVAASQIVEMLRPVPKRPEQLAWASGIPIQYVDISGVKVRYINTGARANLVLLHRLRTHLDVFAKIIPELAGRFTVYSWRIKATCARQVHAAASDKPTGHQDRGDPHREQN